MESAHSAHGFPKIERDSRLMLSKKITFSKRNFEAIILSN